jgi:hypothetical protein
MMMNPEHDDEREITTYGDPGIRSAEAKIPKWLIATYILLPIWGVLWWIFFWNGSYGWLDRGYWNELQKAANTTFPIINQNDPNIKE